MKHGSGMRSPLGTSRTSKQPDIRESGIVPARPRGHAQAMPRAVSLRTSRDGVSRFGATIAGAGDLLLVGARLEQCQPFAMLYRVTDEGVVRERVLRGARGHDGPSIATDGRRVAVGQPTQLPAGGTGFVSVYRRREGEAGELALETTLELKRETESDSTCAAFGQVVAIDHDLLAVGQPASVIVYRHSAVGWLSAGSLRPTLPYEWNPRFGLSCAVMGGRVLVGNPVEVDGHRAGPGRVFVYRQEGDHMELEAELTGDGIEGGRESEPRPGFGESFHVAGELLFITAPSELSPAGLASSRVYVYRARAAELVRIAALDVPSCRSVCVVGERVFVLGDELYVFGRQGNSFALLATYPVHGASADQVTMAACGALLVLGYPLGHAEHAAAERAPGEVALHFAEQL
jgi:hypothetical protein